MNGVIYTVLSPELTPEETSAALAALKRAYAFREAADLIAQELCDNINRNVLADAPS